MATTNSLPLAEYLKRQYSFQVVADEEGGYVIAFPDLPGCLSQVETLNDVGSVADEIRALWIETAYERGIPIPPPSYSEEYSGRFNLRIPRTLHRRLAKAAEREGVSLNQYVTSLLARGDSEAELGRQLARLEARLEAIQRHLPYRTASITRQTRPKVAMPSISHQQKPVAA